MTQSKKFSLYFTYSLLICLAAALFIITRFTENSLLFFVFVTLFTTVFHFTIRFSLANLIYKVIAPFCTYDRLWFREWPFEKSLYRFMAVKKWKGKLPTWNERDFKVSSSSFYELLNNVCKAEVYHELCMALSFVPLLFSMVVGKFWIFFWTSLFGAAIDWLFVCIQRYNRPRIIKLNYINKE